MPPGSRNSVVTESGPAGLPSGSRDCTRQCGGPRSPASEGGGGRARLKLMDGSLPRNRQGIERSARYVFSSPWWLLPWLQENPLSL